MIAAALSTNVMTVVDTLMVSQLGNAALGGVGMGGQIFFLFLAVAMGLSAGVQAMVARRVGEGRLKLTGKVLNAGILLAFAAGLPLIALGYWLSPLLLGVINNDPLLIDEALAYLNGRLPSLLLMGLTLTFRSYWVGVSLAKWSMVSILALSLANILFNYMLIFGNYGAPQLGVAGAGLGSTLAVLVGLLVNVGFALRLAVRNGFLRGLPEAGHSRTIVQIAYPETLRQLFFSVGVMLLYVLVGHIGTQELAAFHVVVSVCLIAYMPHMGFGGAATTLVGEALGRRNMADAKLWGWQLSNTGLLVLTALALVVLLFPQSILRLFFVDSGTLTIAIIPLQIAVVAHVLDGYGKIIAAALIGAGATQTAMRLTLLPQYLLLIPILGLTVFLGYGLSEAMLVFLGSSVISALLFACVWQRANWNAVKI